MATRTRLTMANMGQVLKDVQTLAQVAMLNTAVKIAEDAKELAPKDTTALTESIHVATTEHSDYGIAMSNAQQVFEQARTAGRTPKGVRLGPNSKFLGLEEIKPDNPLEVWVVVGMSYAVDNEYGTVHHGPQPFLVPATKSNIGFFTEQIRKSMANLSVRATFTELSKL